MKNNIIDVYDRISKKYYEVRENMALMPEIEKLCGLLNKGDHILDAGCGNGRDLMIFNKKGFYVTGIDFSDGQLNFARQRITDTKISLEKQDILHLDFPENSFNAIWCCAVLSHYRKSDVIKVLKSFFCLLKSGGLSFIILKKGKGEQYVVEKEFDGITRFTTFFSEEDIYEMAEESSFSVIDIYSYNEQERFSICNRNIDFIVAILKK